MLIRDIPQAERPREKLLERGPEYLTNSELLAAIIGTGTRNMSAVAIADRILFTDARGLAFLTECTPGELAAIDGVGTAKACQIKAAVELGRRISERRAAGKVNADNPASVAALFMDRLRDKQKEFFKVLLLNSKAEVISSEDMAVGDLSRAAVHPREVFNIAVRKSAAAIVLVHNHPSGSPEPSDSDREMTAAMAAAGKILGIKVVDHIIIGDGVYYSFREKKDI